MDGIAGILLATGLSSPGESFKALTQLNGTPMIGLTLQGALDSSLQSMCIVTDRYAGELEYILTQEESYPLVEVKGLEPLAPASRHCVFVDSPFSAAEDPELRFLLDVRVGLAALLTQAPAPPQAVFVVPASGAGISAHTYVALAQYAADHPAPLIVPSYRGKRGYPLLIGQQCFDALLDATEHDALLARTHNASVSANVSTSTNATTRSTRALTEVLDGFAWHELPLDDPGILLNDCTTPALDELTGYVKKTRGVSPEIVGELFLCYDTPSNVQAHTAAVATVALRMATRLNALGYGLDTGLCWAGGALHDLNRLERNHSQVAAAHLRELGYDALAGVVGSHDQELVMTPCMFTEANLVFVADKLVKETTLVNIKHRYQGAVKRFPPSTSIGKLIERDSRNALKLVEQYAELTGDTALLEGTSDMTWRSYHAKT